VDPQGIAVREEPVHEAAMTLDDEIGLPEAALDDRVESQEPGRVNLGAGAIGQPGTKIFHELGHRDEAMPGLQVGIRAESRAHPARRLSARSPEWAPCRDPRARDLPSHQAS